MVYYVMTRVILLGGCVTYWGHKRKKFATVEVTTGVCSKYYHAHFLARKRGPIFGFALELDTFVIEIICGKLH